MVDVAEKEEMSEASIAPRRRVHELFAHEAASDTGRSVRTLLILLIAFSVITAILESVPHIGRTHGALLDGIQLVTTLGFAIEYGLRIWVAAEDPGARSAAQARRRYILSLPGIIDLVAAIPFTLATHIGLPLDWLDITPIFKLLRHTAAFQFLVEAVYSERRVLGSAGLLMVALLVFQSALVYYFERDAQPDKFGSIPEAMWWGIVTLTTVGYGDVTPVTVLGKMAGGLTAIMGVCMFAIPVGIIASAFIEAVRRREFVDTWNLVAKVPLFRNLDASRIAAVAGVLRARRAEREERLIRKGDPGDSMYFVVSGDVEVDSETGAPKGRLGPGDFFGEIALISDRPRTATITAVTACRLLVLHKDDFESFMDAHPDLKAAVQIAADRRLQELNVK